MARKKKDKELTEEDLKVIMRKIGDMPHEKRIAFFKEWGIDLLAQMSSLMWGVMVKIDNMNVGSYTPQPVKKYGISHYCKECGNDLWEAVEVSAKLNNISINESAQSMNACGKCGNSVREIAELPRWAKLMKEGMIELYKTEIN